MKKLYSIFFICLAAVSFAQSPRILVPFRSGNKWGYSDTLGKIKIQPRYDSASLFNYDAEKKGNVIATVKLNGKQMIINDKGSVLVPARYDWIDVIQTLEDFAFYVVKKDKKGVVTKGKELLLPVYDELFPIEGNYFQVKKEGKWGIIDATGKIVVRIVNKELWTDNSQVGFVTIHAYENVDPKSYLLKIGQKFPSPPQFAPSSLLYDTSPSEEKLNQLIDSVIKGYGLDSIQMKIKQGIVYKNGRQGIFLPEEEKKIYFFSRPYIIHQIKYFSGYEKATMNKGLASIIASQNGKLGMLNENEKLVLPFQYDSIEEKDGFFLLKQNGKVGFLIWNTFYPPIKPAWDQYVKKEAIRVNYQWSLWLFEVRKNGKRGFVGENGVAFFKN